jgi:hypothetical protein
VDLLSFVREHVLEGIVLVFCLALVKLHFLRNPPILAESFFEQFKLLIVDTLCFARKQSLGLCNQILELAEAIWLDIS